MSNPVIDNLDDLESLLFAAEKYEMRCIIDLHKRSCKNRAFMQGGPLHFYAIACRCGLDDQAKNVARSADLLTVIRRSQCHDLKGLTLASHCRLITFLVERDNNLHLILERGWVSFESHCICVKGQRPYQETQAKQNGMR